MSRDGRDAAVLPAEVGERFRELFGLDERPVTAADLVRGWDRRWPLEGPLTAEALYADAPTRHEARIGGDVRHTHCVLDALMLASLTGEPVEVVSRSPVSDRGVKIRLDAAGLRDVAPPSAVVSVGAASDLDGGIGDAVCGYINAFADADEYVAWRQQVPEAATAALPSTTRWRSRPPSLRLLARPARPRLQAGEVAADGPGGIEGQPSGGRG
jgi:hypothetical protein